jgi:hypothetical protein
LLAEDSQRAENVERSRAPAKVILIPLTPLIDEAPN